MDYGAVWPGRGDRNSDVAFFFSFGEAVRMVWQTRLENGGGGVSMVGEEGAGA